LFLRRSSSPFRHELPFDHPDLLPWILCRPLSWSRPFTSADSEERASVAFRFDRLIVGHESHAIRTARIRREAAPSPGDDIKKGGIGAGVGGAGGAVIF
jgi:hypothetical protein